MYCSRCAVTRCGWIGHCAKDREVGWLVGEEAGGWQGWGKRKSASHAQHGAYFASLLARASIYLSTVCRVTFVLCYQINSLYAGYSLRDAWLGNGGLAPGGG